MSDAMSVAERPPIWALLVGVNEYGINLDPTRASEHISSLRGCVPDVEAVDLYLRAQLGVPSEQIRLLRDSEATYQRVIDGFADILKRAPAGHQALVYFSCHGSQAPAVDPSIEADGLDETLVLYDSRTEGVYDLLDKELGYLLDQLVRHGLNVTVVLDACHSGSGTREIDMDVRVRSTPRGFANTQHRPCLWWAGCPELARSRQGASDWVNPAAGAASYVVIAGCRDQQLSREATTVLGPRGLLSYYLMEELQRGTHAATTYADLAHVVRAHIYAHMPDQEPQCEGDVHRLIFAAGRVRRRPPIGLKRPSGENATVEIGAAQGLSAGSQLLAFSGWRRHERCQHGAGPPGNRAGWRGRVGGTGDRVAGYARRPAGAADSRRCSRSSHTPTTPRSRSISTARGSMLFVRRWTGPGRVISHRPTSSWPTSAARARLVVSRQGDALRLSSAHGQPADPGHPASCWVPPGPGAAGRCQAVLKLEHLARYWYAYALAPDARRGYPGRARACRDLPCDGPWFAATGRADPQQRSGGAHWRVPGAAHDQPAHRRSLYQRVGFCTRTGSIKPLYPGNGGSVRLVPDNPVLYRLSGAVDLAPGLEEGVDLLKVFVTSESTQAFKSLEMDALGAWQRDYAQECR